MDSAEPPDAEKIGHRIRDAFRPLGFGFRAAWCALLMSMGVPDDSDHAGDHAGAIMAIMCGEAYLT